MPDLPLLVLPLGSGRTVEAGLPALALGQVVSGEGRHARAPVTVTTIVHEVGIGDRHHAAARALLSRYLRHKPPFAFAVGTCQTRPPHDI